MSKHLARVGRVDLIKEIPGADLIQTAVVFGFETIVSKAVRIGDIGIFFEAGDTQLSDDFCKNNNLYRHNELNADNTKKGYVEDNRKLKVQRFLKVKSEGLFMSMDCLAFTGADISNLKFGDAFDEINGIKICNKFINLRTARLASANQKRKKGIHTPLFHQHVDTEQLAYFINTIPKGALITIAHKWHGTSHRVTHTEVLRRQLKRQEKSFLYRNKLLKQVTHAEVVKSEYEYVAGSRRVVLLDEHSEKEGFHGSEKWRFDILEQFKPYLEKNMTIYMEVVGYVNNSPIMGEHDISKLKDPKYIEKYGKKIVYKYGCREGEYKIKIYRISFTNPDGIEMDMSHAQLEDWCKKRNFLYAESMVPPFIYDGNGDALMEMVKKIAENEENLCADYYDPSHINEGVVVRVDSWRLVPEFFKYKTFPFRLLENIIKLNDDFVDMEDAS